MSNKKMNEAMTMVMLPQSAWEQMLQKLESITSLLEVNTPVAAASSSERIPLVLFKSDKELAKRYGISYTVVRELALSGSLKTYCDVDRKRGRWTTHEDILSYFNSVKKLGIRS
jgi:hypothetical protein